MHSVRTKFTGAIGMAAAVAAIGATALTAAPAQAASAHAEYHYSGGRYLQANVWLGAGQSFSWTTSTKYLGSGSGPSTASKITNKVVISVTGIAVSLGFLTVFGAVGLAIYHLSASVDRWTPWATLVIGVVLVVLGLLMLRGWEPVLNLPKVQKGGRDRTDRLDRRVHARPSMLRVRSTSSRMVATSDSTPSKVTMPRIRPTNAISTRRP